MFFSKQCEEHMLAAPTCCLGSISLCPSPRAPKWNERRLRVGRRSLSTVNHGVNRHSIQALSFALVCYRYHDISQFVLPGSEDGQFSLKRLTPRCVPPALQLRLVYEAHHGLEERRETRDYKTAKFVEACFEAAPQVRGSGLRPPTTFSPGYMLHIVLLSVMSAHKTDK